jgi:hypothetical protein
LVAVATKVLIKATPSANRKSENSAEFARKTVDLWRTTKPSSRKAPAMSEISVTAEPQPPRSSQPVATEQISALLAVTPTLTDDELIARRSAWFYAYKSQKNVFTPKTGGPCSCPCCGHVTLSELGGYEICDECGWEDDGQDDHDAHIVRGGPNGRESLNAAREAYVQQGGTPLPRQPPTEAT